MIVRATALLTSVTILSAVMVYYAAAQSSSPPSPAAHSSPDPATSIVTTFECVPYQPDGYATVARRGARVTPPMIVWTSSLGSYTPEERCAIVSNRLTRAVTTAPDSKFKNLQLTYGRVNNLPVICHVSSMTEGCTSDNLLFTLRVDDYGKEREILQQLVTFSVYGIGNPVQQNQIQCYAPLGEAIDRAFTPTATASTAAPATRLTCGDHTAAPAAPIATPTVPAVAPTPPSDGI